MALSVRNFSGASNGTSQRLMCIEVCSSGFYFKRYLISQYLNAVAIRKIWRM